MAALSVGAQAPDFTLTGIDGRQYSLSAAIEQGPLLAVFIQTTCPVCDLAMPYLNRLTEAYGDQGWQLWVITQDDQEASRRYAQRFGATFPLVVDDPADGWKVSRAYDPPATPTLFLIGPDGRLQFSGQGFSKADLNDVSDRIAGHLGVQPAVVAERDDGNPDLRPG
ncbi:MAG: redoxin domain-containing protein [Dehalococcoidia bacterium]|nr:MAG: redoxin domain-containing protein [Dehalococcoidia bacterium]